MSVTQTVDIPDSHRLTIDVPREVPAGKTVLTFTPASVIPAKYDGFPTQIEVGVNEGLSAYPGISPG